MNNFNLRVIKKDLKVKNTISAKLDYWKGVIEEFINKPLEKEFGKEFSPEMEIAFKKLFKKLFKEYKYVTTLYIPASFFIKHFANNVNDPEFTFWFLQFNAQNLFEIDKSRKKLAQKLETSLAKNFIESELKKIKDFELHAENLLHEGRFEIFDKYSDSEFEREIEYLRIKAKYYETRVFPEALNFLNITVRLYAEHIYLKKYLEEQHYILVQPQPIAKQKPELNKKLITFKNSEIIEKIHSELKGYFPNKEGELLKALHGEQLTEILLFPHNQNKMVEVFRRLKYNGFLLNNDTQTKNWICSTFQFIKKGYEEPQPFNENTVWNNLNKGKGEPTKKERICVTEWLPYLSPRQLELAAQKEKL